MDQQEKMFALVEAYQQSGQSQKDFCRDQFIKTSTFSYWIKKKRLQDHPSANFIKLDTTVSASSEAVEILYPNGVSLKIKQTDMTMISALIRLY